MSRKIDKRTIKTKNALCNAIIDCIVNNPHKKITIGTLTRSININRNTFYLHYRTLKDLLNDSINFVSKKILSKVKEIALIEYITSPLLLMKTISTAITNNETYMRFIFDSGYSKQIIDKIDDDLSFYIVREYKRIINSQSDLYYFSINFLVCGYLYSLSAWYHNKPNYDLSLIHHQISKLCLYGIKETYMIELNKNNK